jgi:hypothetical protein
VSKSKSGPNPPKLTKVSPKLGQGPTYMLQSGIRAQVSTLSLHGTFSRVQKWNYKVCKNLFWQNVRTSSFANYLTKCFLVFSWWNLEKPSEIEPKPQFLLLKFMGNFVQGLFYLDSNFFLSKFRLLIGWIWSQLKDMAK